MPPGPNHAPLLLGRDREIAAFRDALVVAETGSPQTVLVGGDAGIGKTTLVTEAARYAAELGYAVAIGHCLDLEAGISFAPVVEAVGVLLSGVEDLGARPSARRMRTLLDPDSPRSTEPFRVMEDLRQTILEAAAAGPVMVVLEDMHWADRSTQDLVLALSRTARGQLLLVLSFRSDDLHRRHPFRKSLREIGHAPGSQRLDLDPLDRASVAGIVAAHSAGQADASVVEVVLSRSEGNPLYAEELVAAVNQPRMPEHLSDLFLVRIDALGKEAWTLLRAASISGTRLDTDNLAALSRLDQERVDTLLREALDANVLRHGADTLEFRHGLLREAVYDDLLPDERTRIHTDLAAILQATADSEQDPGLFVLSRAAFHWDAAHELPRTLAASIRAGLAAQRMGAAEAVTHLERALAVWDQVPDAEAVAGHPRAELMIVLASALMDQGGFERMHTLVHEAVNLMGPDTDPLLASRVYSALGECWITNDNTVNTDEAIRLAVEFAGDHPTEELARALVAQSSFHLVSDHRVVWCLEAATRAAEVAEIAGCVDVRVDALRNSARALALLGRVEEAIDTQKLAIQISRDAGWPGRVIFDTGELAGLYLYSGRVDRACDIGRQGYKDGRALGLGMQAGMCAGRVHEALTWDGCFSEAEQLLEELFGHRALPPVARVEPESADGPRRRPSRPRRIARHHERIRR